MERRILQTLTANGWHVVNDNEPEPVPLVGFATYAYNDHQRVAGLVAGGKEIVFCDLLPGFAGYCHNGQV